MPRAPKLLKTALLPTRPDTSRGVPYRGDKESARGVNFEGVKESTREVHLGSVKESTHEVHLRGDKESGGIHLGGDKESTRGVHFRGDGESTREAHVEGNKESTSLILRGEVDRQRCMALGRLKRLRASLNDDSDNETLGRVKRGSYGLPDASTPDPGTLGCSKSPDLSTLHNLTKHTVDHWGSSNNRVHQEVSYSGCGETADWNLANPERCSSHDVATTDVLGEPGCC